MLAAMLARFGAEVDVLPVVADDEDAHRAALERGLAADVLVTSGGVSMGPHDLVRRVEAELGVEELFWGVAVKPGSRCRSASAERRSSSGFPGTPSRRSSGRSSSSGRRSWRCRERATSGPRTSTDAPARRCAGTPHRDEFVRARRSGTDDGVVLEPVSGQESHMIVRAATADALVHVPARRGRIDEGSPVRYLVLA